MTRTQAFLLLAILFALGVLAKAIAEIPTPAPRPTIKDRCAALYARASTFPESLAVGQMVVGDRLFTSIHCSEYFSK